MNYRLYIAAKDDGDKTKVAYAFFNQHDSCIYRRVVTREGQRGSDAYIAVAAAALGYFAGHIRSRYYDEHFATLLDEDGVTFYTSDPALCDAAVSDFRNGVSLAEYEPLRPYFETWSMSFAPLLPDCAEQAWTERLLVPKEEIN